MRQFYIIFFCVFISSSCIGQITFDANFENARLDTAYLDSSSYRLWPITNLHFRISNAMNQQPTLKIYDSLGYQLRSYHYMVYRYEGDSVWNFFDTAYKANPVSDYHFMNHNPFLQDTVYISYWFPYTYSDLNKYLSGLAASPYLINFGIKTHSYQGRNIYGYEITDPSYHSCYKKNVVITGRQHPTEFISGYFVEGLSNYLLYSTDSIADLVRRKYRFFIYPMLNPDGVVTGIGTNVLGQDLNRSWEDSLIISNIPESDSIRTVIWNETMQKVNWSIDVHSNAGNNLPFYWWGYTNASPVPFWQQLSAQNFVLGVSASDSSGPMSQTLFQNYIQGNGVSPAKTAANWFRESFDAIAFTFEPTTEPLGPFGDNRITIADYRNAGASLIKGFAVVADSVPYLNGQISQNNNQLIVSVSGGFPPYTYNWSGPLSGNSDTLLNAVSGTYIIEVMDSLGCTWSDTITFMATNSSQHLNTERGLVSISPNPVNSTCFIRLEKNRKPFLLSVYHLHGSLMIKKNFHQNLSGVELNVSDFPAGMYFIEIHNDAFYSNSKLLVY